MNPTGHMNTLFENKSFCHTPIPLEANQSLMSMKINEQIKTGPSAP